MTTNRRAARSTRSTRPTRAARTTAPARLAGLVTAALLGLTGLAGCSGGDTAAEDPPPVTLAEVPGQDGLKQVTLTDAAAERLALQTATAAAPVTAVPGVTVTVPYAAVVYDADGATWTYVPAAGRNSWVRTRIEVASIAGDTARLSVGPAAGTPVVVVGAAELMGAEAEISGEE